MSSLGPTILRGRPCLDTDGNALQTVQPNRPCVMSIQASRDTQCNGTVRLLEARIVYNALVYRSVQCAITQTLTVI